MGVLIQSSWFLYLGISLTIAVDRLLIFISPYQTIINTCMTNSLLILSWLFFLAIAILISLPGYGFTYDSLYLWNYNNAESSVSMSNIEAYFDCIVLVVIFVIYLVVFFKLLKLERLSSNQCSFFMVELRMFIVSIISFIYETIFVVWSFWLPPLFEDQDYTNIALNLDFTEVAKT
ncbi:hypothetical protein L596_021787 [Steinernema carpocapsae]|uniref:7TM GPCR serpentine receptor class x (Srx) domain-containing protein n=1 Tax=Steinernema carpocapsae TaxID=34508 RepID=A0A4V6A010_STECR|nr:hypothetical protein L596_021787 [Steinernema carpocapsae]